MLRCESLFIVLPKKFKKWAFGEDYEDLLYSLEVMERWNELHSDKLLLDKESSIADDLEKMMEIWESQLSH